MEQIGEITSGAKKISIVVPVYQNEGSLIELITRIMRQKEIIWKKYHIDCEIIFVNDGSTDSSLECLLFYKTKHDAKFKVVSFTKNFGAFSAIKAGVTCATGEAILILSADLQDPPELIEQIIDHWNRGCPYVICQRQTRDDPKLSKIFSYLYYFLIRKIVIRNYPRSGFDFFLLEKRYFKVIIRSGKAMNTLLYSYWLGLKPEIIKYDRLKRGCGKSTWSFRKKFRLFIDTFLGFSVFPIKLMSFFGIITSFLSFSYSIYIVILKFLDLVPVSGFASIMSVMTFLFGLVMMMMGIIGEYVSRIYDELNGKSEYLIESIYE